MSESWEILAPGWAVFYWPLEESGKRFDIIRKAGAYYQPVCSNVSGEDRASLIAAAPELKAVALAYEQWEADVLLGADWSNSTPRLTQAQWDRMVEIQAMRNAAIAKARGE